MSFVFSLQPQKDNPILLQNLHYNISCLLREHGSESASLDSRLLICNACKISYEDFIANPDKPLSHEELEIIDDYIKRRMNGEPVSKIVGYREFWGHRFITDKSTLDPRPDTETLVEFVLEFIPETDRKNKKFRILDLGTGSGCILLSLLSEFTESYGVGVDISASALKIAKNNAINLGLNDRIDFIQSNWLDSISGKFDIIVSNPPYIPQNDIESLKVDVRNYDPISALNGGVDGLEAYKKIIPQIYKKLQDYKLIVFEVGKNQEESVKNLLNTYKSPNMFSNISYKCDLSGIKRCVAFEKKIETFCY